MSALKYKVMEFNEHMIPSLPANEAQLPLMELINVCKGYGETSILKNINLTVKEGEFIAIVGFSGSGKSTLISLIAGLISADSGEVLKQGNTIAGPGPDRGVVFQNYSLMPWLSVYENGRVAPRNYPLRLSQNRT